MAMNRQARATPTEVEVILPYAAACGGSGSATLRIRPLTGDDELAFDEAMGEGAAAVQAATLLIGRCALVEDRPIGPDAARSLALGDREVLLRAIYMANFGADFAARVECGAGCAEGIEFDVDVAGLTEPAPEAGPTHSLVVAGETVACRVPTGADLERALGLGSGAAEALAAACTGGRSVDPELLSRELSRLDPNAECALGLACPSCGAPVDAVLDGLELIRTALAESGGFMMQVDRLARAYGWTEAEILALPRSRRLRYCALAEAGAAA